MNRFGIMAFHDHIELYPALHLKQLGGAINAAREDAIRECAERAQAEGGDGYGMEVDKESILNLISELK